MSTLYFHGYLCNPYNYGVGYFNKKLTTEFNKAYLKEVMK